MYYQMMMYYQCTSIASICTKLFYVGINIVLNNRGGLCVLVLLTSYNYRVIAAHVIIGHDVILMFCLIENVVDPTDHHVPLVGKLRGSAVLPVTLLTRLQTDQSQNCT